MGDSQHNEALYMKLLDVVGTEEEIKLRQDVFRCMDVVNGFGDNDSVSISGGSLSEGFNLKGGDEDIMIVLKNIDVVHDVQLEKESDFEVTINMKMSETRPGYASLYLAQEQKQKVMAPNYSKRTEVMNIKKAIEKSGDQCIVASSRFRGQFIIPGNESHGPCISDGIYDFAISLKGSSWPTLANDRLDAICTACPNWITKSLACELLSKGCIYVPVGPKHFYSGTLWRVSFATAEKRLVWAMNHTQILCYGLLKIVLKEGIAKELPREDLLCSYFIKTCMFWTIEETHNNPEIWKPKQIFSCYKMCMDKLIQWVETCTCPNYFLPSNNMFFDRITDQNRDCVLYYLKKYRHGGYNVLSKCPTLGDYITCKEHRSEIDREANLDLFVYRSLHIYPFDDVETLLLGLNALEDEYQRQSHEYTKDVITALIASLHQQIAQMIKLPDNKEDKTLLKLQEEHLRKGCQTDKLCGLTLLASYHCTTGAYYSALEILKHVLQRLVPGSGIVLRRNPEYYTEEVQLYKEKFCGKNLSLLQKFEIGTLRNIVLLDNSPIVPEVFQPEVYNYRPLILMPPAVYAQALRCVCYSKINDKIEMEKALTDLENMVQDNFFIKQEENFKSTAKTIVGACYEESGNYEKAKLYYEEALNETKICRSVKNRIERLKKKMIQST